MRARSPQGGTPKQSGRGRSPTTPVLPPGQGGTWLSKKKENWWADKTFLSVCVAWNPFNKSTTLGAINYRPVLQHAWNITSSLCILLQLIQRWVWWHFTTNPRELFSVKEDNDKEENDEDNDKEDNETFGIHLDASDAYPDQPTTLEYFRRFLKTCFCTNYSSGYIRSLIQMISGWQARGDVPDANDVSKAQKQTREGKGKDFRLFVTRF